MSAKRAIEREIGRYLETVAAELADMPADEKDDILRDIESHIYAALEEHGPNPTVDDLNVILAGMDRPSAWAEGARGEEGETATPAAVTRSAGGGRSMRRRTCETPRQASFSKTALAAGVTAPLALALLLFAYIQVSPRTVTLGPMTMPHNSVFRRQAFGQFTGTLRPSLTAHPAAKYAALGIGLASVCTVLGLVALSKIRAARGALSGLPLAAACAVCFPVLAADAFVIALAWTATERILGNFSHASESELRVLTIVIVATLTLIIVLTLSIWAFRKAWRWANRPLKPGEFT